MLGITFKGRYKRKQFWIFTLITAFLVPLLLLPISNVVSRDAYEISIAEEIIHEKGSITPTDIEEYRNKIRYDERYSEGKKRVMVQSIAKLEGMSTDEIMHMKDRGLSMRDMFGLFICIVCEIYAVIFGFSVHVKRGHDHNISGLVTFILMIIPLINLGLLIYYGFFAGDETDNDYGPPPV